MAIHYAYREQRMSCREGCPVWMANLPSIYIYIHVYINIHQWLGTVILASQLLPGPSNHKLPNKHVQLYTCTYIMLFFKTDYHLRMRFLLSWENLSHLICWSELEKKTMTIINLLCEKHIVLMMKDANSSLVGWWVRTSLSTHLVFAFMCNSSFVHWYRKFSIH